MAGVPRALARPAPRVALAAILAFIAVLATSVVPTWTADAASRCRVRVPGSVESGSPFVIRGVRFGADRRVTVQIIGPTGTQTLRVSSDANGAFRLRLAAAWGDQGRWKVTARAGKGARACVAHARYVVTPGPSPTPAAEIPSPVTTPESPADAGAQANVSVVMLAIIPVIVIVVALGSLVVRRRGSSHRMP